MNQADREFRRAYSSIDGEGGEANGRVVPGLSGRVLLGERISGGAEPPAQLVAGFLYAARLASVSSEPGEGKTILALWIALQVLREGRPVLYFDAENGPAPIAERLEAMGADAAELDRSFHYFPSPEISLEAGAIKAVIATVETVRPALAVFDSLPDFLALAGLSENDAGDVTGWTLAIPQRLKDLGCSVLLLDHLTKSPEGRGRYARGSGAKLAKMDVAWSLTQTLPFDRGRVGEISLALRKDRDAYLPTRQRFAVGGGEGGLVFRRADGVIEEPGIDGLTDGARRALEALQDGHQTGLDGLTFTDWMHAADLPKTTFRRAVKDLQGLGLTDKRGHRYHPKPAVEGPRGNGPDLGPDAKGQRSDAGIPSFSENSCKSEGPQGPRPQVGSGGPGTEGPQGPPPYRGGPDGPGPAPEVDERLASFLADPPDWYFAQAGECLGHGMPDRLINPLASAVSEEVFGTPWRWREVSPVVREALEKGAAM